MGKQLFFLLPQISQLILLHSPICPQGKLAKSMEEILFGIPQQDIPHQDLRQDEFECLNLNITCPAGLTIHSRLPVMLWIHGFVFFFLVAVSLWSYFQFFFSVVAIKVLVQHGFTTVENLFAGA